MNKENLPDRDNPDVYGHSIGEIIDGKLIIETDNFIPTKWGIGQGLDSSSSKHVTEVYSLKEDGHILEIVYTVSDPVYLKEPFSKTHKRTIQDYKLTEYEECDPEFAKMHSKENQQQKMSTRTTQKQIKIFLGDASTHGKLHPVTHCGVC